MAKIKIKDLPKDYKITEDEMKRIRGGLLSAPSSLLYIKIDGSTSLAEYKDLNAISFIK